MSESPSAVAWNGDLHVFHQGGYQNGDLLFAYFDGTNWHPDTLVQNVGMSGAPSGLALSPVTGTTLFAPSVAQVGTVSAIAATNADGSLWYYWQQIGSSQWNAEQVSGPGAIAGAAPSVAPVGKGSAIAAIHADGSLWYYWQPIGSSQWNPEQVSGPGRVAGAAPSVAQVGTVSAIAATNADGSLWYLWQQIGSSQWNAEQVSGPGTIAGAAPSVAAVGEVSAIAANHADGSLWYYWQQIGSSQWNAEQVSGPGRIAGAAPSVAQVGTVSAIAATNADGSLWYSGSRSALRNGTRSRSPGRAHRRRRAVGRRGRRGLGDRRYPPGRQPVVLLAADRLFAMERGAGHWAGRHRRRRAVGRPGRRGLGDRRHQRRRQPVVLLAAHRLFAMEPGGGGSTTGNVIGELYLTFRTSGVAVTAEGHRLHRRFLSKGNRRWRRWPLRSAWPAGGCGLGEERARGRLVGFPASRGSDADPPRFGCPRAAGQGRFRLHAITATTRLPLHRFPAQP